MSEEIQEESGLVNELKSNKVLVISFVVLLVGILGIAAYLGIKKYKETKNVESAAAYSALLFEMDSTDVTDDLIANAEEFEGYKGGSIAAYAAARKLMDEEEFDEALSLLEQVELEDVMVMASAKGLIGDCYSEKGEYEAAYEAYNKAADYESNDFTSSKYLMKAGLVAEELNNYSAALECYKKIKENYPDSSEGRTIDKDIARTENM